MSIRFAARHHRPAQAIVRRFHMTAAQLPCANAANICAHTD
jgi:hypothetical protein